jgi:hypothetical protein
MDAETFSGGTLGLATEERRTAPALAPISGEAAGSLTMRPSLSMSPAFREEMIISSRA